MLIFQTDEEEFLKEKIQTTLVRKNVISYKNYVFKKMSGIGKIININNYQSWSNNII